MSHHPRGAQAGVSEHQGSTERSMGENFFSAEELMYFLGAPLAHVVLYEACLRAKRLQKGYGRGLPLHHRRRSHVAIDIFGQTAAAEPEPVQVANAA